MKREIEIQLKTIHDVRELCDAAQDVKTKVYAKHGEYTVDCKSILGLFSLDWSAPITVIYEENEEKFQNYLLSKVGE